VTAEHRCGPRCICPIHETRLIWWPSGREHACRDVECVHGRGGLPSEVASYYWPVVESIQYTGNNDTEIAAWLPAGVTMNRSVDLLILSVQVPRRRGRRIVSSGSRVGPPEEVHIGEWLILHADGQIRCASESAYRKTWAGHLRFNLQADAAKVDRQTVAGMTALQVHEKLRRALDNDRLDASASHDLDYAQDLMEALDAELAEHRMRQRDDEKLWGDMPMLAALRLPILVDAMRIIYGEPVRMESKGAFLLVLKQSDHPEGESDS
jgi:hypothetical protein